ncbi:ABC transporter permease [Aerococcus christensenii]|uniref:ABC-2 type transporter transmembrane domain-containing protein n=1 Tax=Aerococcus christensenii TaxID=87541 RepID=A0A133XT12_9LACT|nr:ABC transporter permease [Aerococcus christensenii]KXB34073.1 hypothetical protein HMPREF3187_01527 [Aerococcus christensenii]MDK8234583.1 ABC transporter permease [Aerococcus christensenii]
MTKIFMVAKETFWRQVKSWSFLLLILGPFLVIGINVGIGVLSQSEKSEDTIGMVIVDQKLSSAFSDGYRLYDNEKQAEIDFEDQKIKEYVTVDVVDNTQIKLTYHGKANCSAKLKQKLLMQAQVVQQTLNQQVAHLKPQQIEQLSLQPQFEEYNIGKTEESVNNTDVKMGSFVILCFFLYLLLMIYVGVTSQEVAVEKGTKIMEIIFSSMPGGDYFIGKLLGLMGEIILHIGIYIVGGYMAWQGVKHLDALEHYVAMGEPFFKAFLKNIGLVNLIYIVIALILSITLAIFCGALSSKPENANKSGQPIFFLVILGFVLGMTFQNQPDSTILSVVSYIPLLSSFTMPIRIINETASTLSVSLSLGINLITLIGVIYLIRRLYPRLILQTDDAILKALKRSFHG